MDPTIGELRLFAFGREPVNFMPCQGQRLRIRQYVALFSLIGYSYGPFDENFFLLPDLRGRTPLGISRRLQTGNSGGEAARLLRPEHLPRHGHPLLAAATEGETAFGDSTYLAASPPGAPPGYTRTAGDRVALHADTVASGPAGTAGMPLDNMQPYLALNWCIAVNGDFPRQE